MHALLLLLPFSCQIQGKTSESTVEDAYVQEGEDVPDDPVEIEERQTDSGTSSTGDTASQGSTDTAAQDTDFGDDCPSGQVYLYHECAPTLDLGCVETCILEEPCPEPGYVCTECAASSSLGSGDCQPACILAYGPHAPVPEPLRISPASGTEEEAASIQIQGTPFYIGALGHRVRLDDELLEWIHYPSSHCTMEVELPSRPSGLYPVWVSQYSGGEPWALSGFFQFGAGESCIQPGMPCAEGEEACCSTVGVPMSCSEERCIGTE
jgi:hypothetical protein